MSRFRVVAVGLLALLVVVPVDGVVHAAPPPADTFHGLVPARLMDTRVGGTTVDGISAGGGAVGPASVRNVTILNRGGVPSVGVGAVALNVTAIGSTASYVTVWPAGAAQPNASNLNLEPGVAIPNMVIVPLGTAGQISLYNDTGNTELLVDVLGWFPTGASFTGLVPARLMDTRPGGSTIDGVSAGIGPRGPASVTNLTVLNRGGVPATGVGSVALNVTATGPTADSYVTVWPAGAVQPNASNLNLRANVTTPNMVIVAVGAGGQISLYNDSGSTNLIVDVLGWFPTGTSFTGLVPGRVMDTRIGGSTVDGQFAGTGPVCSCSVTNLTISNRGGVPSGGVGSVALNVTATGPGSDSYITVWPTGDTQPNASNLNLRTGLTTPNMVIVALGVGGQISLFNASGSTNLIVDVLGWFPSPIVRPTTIRASVRTTGVEALSGSQTPSISSDGRYTVFASQATDLLGLGNDTNGTGDIFLFDRETVTTTRISVSSVGAQSNGDSSDPFISADGNYVVYVSTANNLLGVGNDTNAVSDVFLYDRVNATTTRVSVGLAGIQANAASSDPTISADGGVISFISNATNLVGALDTNGTSDAFVFDRVNSTTTRVSLSDAGVQGDAQSVASMISGDGKFVAFASYAGNLVAGDSNTNYDIFVRNRTNSTTSRASVTSAGVEQVGTGGSLETAISADGRYVAFSSSSDNLVTGDTNAKTDIFVHDNLLGTTIRVSVDSAGTQGDGDSSVPTISADGRYVSFLSISSNLVANDTNGNNDVFVYDLLDATTSRINVDNFSAQSDAAAGPAISANGRFVSFYSGSANLVTGDTNGGNDVFVRDRGTV